MRSPRCLHLPSGGYRSGASTVPMIKFIYAQLAGFFFSLAIEADRGSSLSTRRNITHAKPPVGRHLVGELVSWYR